MAIGKRITLAEAIALKRAALTVDELVNGGGNLLEQKRRLDRETDQRAREAEAEDKALEDDRKRAYDRLRKVTDEANALAREAAWQEFERVTGYKRPHYGDPPSRPPKYGAARWFPGCPIVDANSPMKVATKRNRIAAYYARNDCEIADARGGPDTTVDVDVDLMWELIQAFRDATDVDGVSEVGLRSALAAHGLEVFWKKERS